MAFIFFAKLLKNYLSTITLEYPLTEPKQKNTVPRWDQIIGFSGFSMVILQYSVGIRLSNTINQLCHKKLGREK